MFCVWPAAAMSCPFLSTRKTTLALASLVRRSQTALIRLNSSSYITSCVAHWREMSPSLSRDLTGFFEGFRVVFAPRPLDRTPRTVAGSNAVRQGSAPGVATKRLRARPGSGRVAPRPCPTRRDRDVAPGPGRTGRRGRWPPPAPCDPSGGQRRPGHPPGADQRGAAGAGRLRRLAPPYTEWRSAVLADPGEDGKSVLILTRFGSVLQIAPGGSQPLGTAGAAYLREGAGGQGGVAAGRRPDRLPSPGHRRGGELPAVPARSARPASTELLTDGKSRHEAFVLSPDGRRLAYSGTGRNGKDTDVYLAETASPTTARRLTEEKGSLVAARRSRPTASDCSSSRTGRSTTPISGRWTSRRARRTARHPGRGEGGEGLGAPRAFARRREVGLPGHRPRERLRRAVPGRPRPTPRRPGLRSAPTSPWNVERLAVARDGTVAFAVNEDGYSKLYVLKRRSREAHGHPRPAGGAGPMRFPNWNRSVLPSPRHAEPRPPTCGRCALKTGAAHPLDPAARWEGWTPRASRAGAGALPVDRRHHRCRPSSTGRAPCKAGRRRRWWSTGTAGRSRRSGRTFNALRPAARRAGDRGARSPTCAARTATARRTSPRTTG